MELKNRFYYFIMNKIHRKQINKMIDDKYPILALRYVRIHIVYDFRKAKDYMYKYHKLFKSKY